MGSISVEIEHESGGAKGMLDSREAAKGESVELRRVKCDVTESLWKRMLRVMFPDQRKQERMPMPPLVGYLGTASASKPYDLGDISLTGFCLLTGERWIPGTEMPVTLQRTNLPARYDEDSFTVQATVVRCDSEGVGFSIVLSEEESNAVQGNPLRVKWISRAEMGRFLMRLKDQPDSEGSCGEGRVPSGFVEGTRATAQLKTAYEGSH